MPLEPFLQRDRVVARFVVHQRRVGTLGRERETDPPHILLLPEQSFDEDRFLASVENVVRRAGYALVVASEMLRDGSGALVGTDRIGRDDSFGHAESRRPGDVLQALQQGAIDGSIAGIGPFVHLHFMDAAKYVTETNQPAIFIILEVSQKWYDSLPKDLQAIIDKDGAAVSMAINPTAIEMYQSQRKAWVAQGGELINLPPSEQAEMMHTLASVGQDVSKSKPALRDAYDIVADAAKRTRQAPSQ